MIIQINLNDYRLSTELVPARVRAVPALRLEAGAHLARVPTMRSTRPRRPKPTVTHTLDELRQVRALAHPLRLKLLEIFSLGPSTTKQAAERLGVPPTRLYHHVYAMERAGLLRLRETRPKRGTVENYFETTAQGFTVAPRLAERSRGKGVAHPAVAMARQVVEGLREDVREGLPQADVLPDDLKPVLARMIVHGDAAGIRRLRRELLALIHRRSRRPVHRDVAAATQRYVMTLALMPVPLGKTAAGRPPRGPRGSR